MRNKQKSPRQLLDKWLHLAREGSLKEDVSYEVEQVYCFMDQVDVPLQTRKKWEIELPLLLLKGYESEAKKWLGIITIRSESEDIEDLIHYIYDFLEKAQIVAEPWLRENGSSGDAIERLKKKGYRSEAEKMLRKARYRVREGNVHFEVDQVWQYVKKAELELEDIKTSEDELEQLLEDGDILESRKNKNKLRGGGI